MIQATTTFLELVNNSVEEAGDDLAFFAADGSDFNTNTDPMLRRFKKWVNRAWRDIQQESFDWEWMSEQAVVNIVPGMHFYSPAAIDWAYTAANPLNIFDVDGTNVIPNLTATKVVDLTGTYTQLENYGYVNLAADLDNPLDFGLKAGGEYFITPGSGLSAIAFTPATRAVWPSGEPAATTPVLTGFASTLTVPTAGTEIVGIRIVTFDETDYTTPTANTLYNITGIARPSTGAAGNAVLELTEGQNLDDFFDNYNLSVTFPQDDVVCVYMVDGSNNLYGGIVKATIHNVNDAFGVLYTVGFHPAACQWTWDVIIGSGTLAEFGGYTGVIGDVLVSGALQFTGAFTGEDCQADIFATLTTDVSPTEGVVMDVVVDVDAADLDVNNHFQDVACFSALDDPDFNDAMYEDAGETSGISVEVLDSGDLQTMASIVVEEGTSGTKNYIHSWKSFDWAEELDDDDFVENVREVNQATFRIISHEQPPTVECKLQFMPWSEFQNNYDLASQPPGVPRMITEDNTGRWRLYPAPNMPYTILFNYVREPVKMVAYTDVPRGLPEEYVDLIMWKTIQYYGEYNEQPSEVQRGYKNYKNLLNRFEQQTRPKFHFVPKRLY